jgi:hypothetical protein
MLLDGEFNVVLVVVVVTTAATRRRQRGVRQFPFELTIDYRKDCPVAMDQAGEGEEFLFAEHNYGFHHRGGLLITIRARLFLASLICRRHRFLDATYQRAGQSFVFFSNVIVAARAINRFIDVFKWKREFRNVVFCKGRSHRRRLEGRC